MGESLKQLLKQLAVLTGKDPDCSHQVTQACYESKFDALIRGNVENYYKVFSSNEDSSIVSSLGECCGMEALSELSKERCKSCFKSNGINSGHASDDYRARKEGCCYEHQWKFIYENIELLKKICLDLDLVSVKTLEHPSSEKFKGDPPKPQPNLLGVKDQAVVTTSLDFLDRVAFKPNLLFEVGSHGKSPTDNPTSLGGAKFLNERMLFYNLRAFYEFSKNSILGPLVISRYLTDLISGLIQLGFSNIDVSVVKLTCNTSSKNINSCVNEQGSNLSCNDCVGCRVVCAHERDWCREKMSDLLSKTYQPFMIKVLLVLQKSGISKGSDHGGSKTKSERIKVVAELRQTCGRFLTQLLMKENGVLNLVQAVCDGSNLDSLVWQKCDAIGKLLATCPQQVQSVEEYYSNICKQVLGLLQLSKKKYGRQVIRIVGSCITIMTRSHPDLTKKYVFSVLMEPWYKCQSEGYSCAIPESKILTSVENIHKVFVNGTDPTDNLLQALGEVASSLFQLYCFTKDSISVLQSLSKEILVWYIRNSGVEQAVTFLRHCVLRGRHPGDDTLNYTAVADQDINFKYGECGGVKVCIKENTSMDQEEDNSSWLSTELAIVCVLSLLKEVRKGDIASQLFLDLLEYLSSSSSESIDNPKEADLRGIDKDIVYLQRDISLISLLSAIGEEFGPSVLKNHDQIGTFVKLALERYCHSLDCKPDVAQNALEGSTCSLALGLLAVLLGQEDAPDYSFYEDILPYLKKLSDTSPDSEVGTTAQQLYIGIATRGAAWDKELHKMDRSTTHVRQRGPELDLMSKELYQKAIEELKDPLIPTRGQALIRLSKMLEVGNSMAIENADNLLEIFRDNVVDDDSYVYLAAIEGLVSLASRKHEVVIPFLAKEFATFPDKAKGLGTKPKISSELRMKLGESLVKATRKCGELVPKYSEVLLAAQLTGTKDTDSLVRASSLSNTAETCKLLRFSVMSSIHEIFSSVSSVVLTDTEKEVRRAATSVLTMLIQGLGKQSISALEGIILDMYRLLKRIQQHDTDEVTRAHAGRALGELDTIMRQLAFPTPELRKEIRILP